MCHGLIVAAVGLCAMIGAMQQDFDPRMNGASASPDEPPSEDQLACELHRLGVRHLSWARDTPPGTFTAASLLLSLATSPDARLRNALVPLFLLRPDFAVAVPGAAARLTGPPRAHLVCAYSAAVVFQRSYGPRVAVSPAAHHTLADHFADELDLPVAADADLRLAAIADRHARLSGEELNWCGTYRHAVEAGLRFAEAIPE